MTTPNNQPSAHEKRKLNKNRKEKESLSFATWVLLIISFSLLIYAIYTIQTRIVKPAIDTGNAKAAQISLVQTGSTPQKIAKVDSYRFLLKNISFTAFLNS